MAKEAYYFSHDTNARRDPKILAMRNQFGNEGYGWYWILIEMLSEQEGYRMEHKQWNYYGIAMDMQSDAIAVEEFVNSLINDYELLVSDGEHFWSESLLRRMELKEAKRNKRIEAGKKGARSRWGKPDNTNEKKKEDVKKNSNAMATAKNSYSNGMANDGKGKESKEKESKEKEIKVVEEENSDVNVHRFYQENFGIETPFITEDIEYWINDLSKEVVTLALQKAIEKNAEYAYAKGILKQWAKKGIKTLDAANAESLSKARKGNYSNNTKTETLPDWVDNQEEDEEVSPEEEASFQKRLQEIRAAKGASQ